MSDYRVVYQSKANLNEGEKTIRIKRCGKEGVVVTANEISRDEVDGVFDCDITRNRIRVSLGRCRETECFYWVIFD